MYMCLCNNIYIGKWNKTTKHTFNANVFSLVCKQTPLRLIMQFIGMGEKEWKRVKTIELIDALFLLMKCDMHWKRSHTHTNTHILCIECVKERKRQHAIQNNSFSWSLNDFPYTALYCCALIVSAVTETKLLLSEMMVFNYFSSTFSL